MTERPDDATPAGANRSPWWRLPILLAVVLAGVVASRAVRDAGESDVRPEASAPGIATGASVSLAIDFGEGRHREYEAIPWQAGMTVRDALVAAAEGDNDSNGTMAFDQQGSGAAAFLTEIDGAENEGAGGRNWLFAVNGEPGKRSFAIQPLRAGDHVLWKFAGPQ